MPILKNAKKALRVSKKRAAVNLPVKSRLKTSLDKVKKTSNPDTTSRAFSAIDKAVRKHTIHKKKAARLKSQVSRLATKSA